MATDESPNEFSDPLENYDPPIYKDKLEAALAEDTASAIQSSPVATVPPELKVSEAVKRLHEDKIACLLVVDENKLMGIFSVRDVLHRVSANYEALKDSSIQEVMTPSPAFAYESDASGAVLSLMAASGYRHVPVLDSHDTVVGVVSPQRIMSFLGSYMNGD